MKAAATEGPGAMRIADVPDAGEPEDGEVLVRPEAVGLCGFDPTHGHLPRRRRLDGREPIRRDGFVNR